MTSGSTCKWAGHLAKQVRGVDNGNAVSAPRNVDENPPLGWLCLVHLTWLLLNFSSISTSWTWWNLGAWCENTKPQVVNITNYLPMTCHCLLVHSSYMTPVWGVACGFTGDSSFGDNQSRCFSKEYPLVMSNIAMENCHWNSEFSPSDMVIFHS